MAFTNGIALDRADLFNKLRAFILAQGWTELRWTPGQDFICAGPGPLGEDEIIVRFYQYNYTLGIQGFHFVTPNGEFRTQCAMKFIASWANPMTYWFTCSHSRVSGVIKVGNYYATFYGGFLETAASREQMPYPMAVMGTSGGDYSYTTTANHTGGMFRNAVVTTRPHHCLAVFSDIENFWRDPVFDSYGWSLPAAVDCVYDATKMAFITRWNATLDGAAFLMPIFMANHGSTSRFSGNKSYVRNYVVGQLDGFYRVNGEGKVAEGTIDIGADSYLLVPNYYRTGRENFVAFRMT